MLILPIKKKWFDMILSGEKKEENREIKPYYDSRFKLNYKLKIGPSLQKRLMTILFRNGYSIKSPTIKCEVLITRDYGKEEWGAEPGKLYYVLRILSVEEIKL